MSFSTVTAVTRTGPGGHGFAAEVDPVWTIGGKPNGGYLLAMMARVAVAVVAHEHVLAASAHYLHSPDPGPVELAAEVLRAGRTASQVRVRLSQAGKACIEALLTIGTLDPDVKPYWDGGLPDPLDTPRDAAVRLGTQSPTGLHLPIMGQVDLRIDPADLAFGTGRPRGLGELHGWLALDGEDFDPVGLLYAVDAFPPATLDVELTGWVPTLELTAYVRALPAPGPLRVLQKARLIEAQRVDEACFVWDSTGRLVAQATQLAGIRLG